MVAFMSSNYPKNLESLLEMMPELNHADRTLIERAYQFAEQAHDGQTRKSGEPYFTHCVAVASILAGLQLDAEVIAAGLLHDTVEDNESIDNADIKSEFGNIIERLVDGVTKISKLPIEDYGLDSGRKRTDRKTLQRMESFRKLLLTMGDDDRVVLVKLADRLHNMRTLDATNSKHQTRTSRETMDFFAPLANRLGIWKIKWELEDLSFKYIEPDAYRKIARALDEKRKVREEYVAKMAVKIREILSAHDIHDAIISSRPKHIYSIYRKMNRKNLPLEKIYDIRAIRIIVQDKKQCYLVLMEIHELFNPIPGEFDDYIAAPKDSSYQSLHTSVIDDEGKTLEVQIRTHEMHEDAEYGIAAHWIYKEGRSGKKDPKSEKRVSYLRRLMNVSEPDKDGDESGAIQDTKEEDEPVEDFVNRMKDEVFEEQVYIFTPKGDIAELPIGSTPIDFAYSIHTEIGHRCRGAKIQGKLQALNYKLQNGDQVEIMTAKRGGPSLDWLNEDLGYTKTSRAKSKIKHWFRQQHRNEHITTGRVALETGMKQLGVLDKLSFDAIARLFSYNKVDNFLVAIGAGTINGAQITRKILEDDERKREEAQKTELELLQLKVRSNRKTNTPGGIQVTGVGDMMTTLAKCCSPLAGDDIVGYVTRGRGVTVHRVDCSNVQNISDVERLIDVTWNSVDEQNTYIVPIEIVAQDRGGLLRDISTLIAAEKINIADVDVKTRQQIASFYFDLRIADTRQLARILIKINNVDSVYEAHRVYQS